MRISLNPFSFVVLAIAGWMSRHQQEIIGYLIEENRVLREQMGNRRLRFNDDQRRRLAAKAKKLGSKILGQVATIATPETLLTWHRKLIAQNYTGSPCRTPGRHPTAREIAALAVRMAEENRSWGYRRIQGALANLGHDLAHNRIRNILKRHGIEPSPERARKTTWKEFLQRHWQQIMASDFFMINPSNRSGLAPVGHSRLYETVDSTRGHCGTAGGTDGVSTIQIAGKMTDDVEGLCKGKRNLIAEEGPRTRCHYRLHGNEPSIRNRLVVSFPASNQKASRVKRRQRLDRLLNHYQCAAA